MRIISKDKMPTDEPKRWERGFSPWHRDAFPDEFKNRVPEQGKRLEGWFGVDWCGNQIGWVPDGTKIDEVTWTMAK